MPKNNKPGKAVPQAHKNKSVMIVLATILINMTGVGLMWPLIPALAEDLSGTSTAQISIIIGGLSVSFALMQFVFAPIMGALSDRFGRRPVMLIALGGLGIDTLLLAFAPNIFWLFIGRAFGGALGSTFPIAQAIMADYYSGKDQAGERAGAFGLIGAAFGVGFILGPLMGGLLGEIDIRLPFFVAGGLALVNCVYGYFFLEETLPADKRQTSAFKNPLAPLFQILKNKPVLQLAGALFLANLIQRGLEAIWVIFTAYQYQWGIFEAGLSLAIVGISYVITQGFLVKPAIRLLGEKRVIIWGLALSALMYAMLAFNTVGLIGFIGIIPHVVGFSLSQTALQSTLSQTAKTHEQGQLQGGLSAITGLATILGPVISTALFSLAVAQTSFMNLPGLYFAIGAMAMITAAALSWKSQKL